MLERGSPPHPLKHKPSLRHHPRAALIHRIHVGLESFQLRGRKILQHPPRKSLRSISHYPATPEFLAKPVTKLCCAGFVSGEEADVDGAHECAGLGVADCAGGVSVNCGIREVW